MKFCLKVPVEGAVFTARGVKRDSTTGLALLKVEGRRKPNYWFARNSVKRTRTVYAITRDEAGHLPPVRGEVVSVHDGSGLIVHNALVGKEGYGSPLFNNCGEIVGVVVPVPDGRMRGGMAAVTADRLSQVFEREGEELELRRAVEGCQPERERLIRDVGAYVLLRVVLIAAVAGAVIWLSLLGDRRKPKPTTVPIEPERRNEPEKISEQEGKR